MEHCLFIQYDISCCQVADFCTLPMHRVWGIVHSVDDVPYARHAFLFNLTH
jgi:hypothetical protein